MVGEILGRIISAEVLMIPVILCAICFMLTPKAGESVDEEPEEDEPYAEDFYEDRG
jgi:hypothetical protein